MNFNSKGIDKYDEAVCALTWMDSYSYTPNKLDLDLKNCPTPLVKNSIKEPLVLEWKELLGHLFYVFLSHWNTLPVIIVVNFVEHQVKDLMSILRYYKRVIGWMIIDITVILPSICTHKIKIDKDYTPAIKH